MDKKQLLVPEVGGLILFIFKSYSLYSYKVLKLIAILKDLIK